MMGTSTSRASAYIPQTNFDNEQVLNPWHLRSGHFRASSEMPKHENTWNCCRQGREEQTRIFQSKYDGGHYSGTGMFPQHERHSASYVWYQLNKSCDPNDEHHILRLRDSFIHRSHLCLVFELLSSNLYELIKQNQFQGLSTQLVKVFMAQLLDALTVLKDARLIHCDLKPENILLKS